MGKASLRRVVWGSLRQLAQVPVDAIVVGSQRLEREAWPHRGMDSYIVVVISTVQYVDNARILGDTRAVSYSTEYQIPDNTMV